TADEVALNLEVPRVVELAAPISGELVDARHLQIQRHLVGCTECTGLLLDLAAFPEVPLRHGRPPRSAEQRSEDWRAIESRILEGTADPPANATDFADAMKLPAEAPSTFSPAPLLAAGFALVSVGLAVLSFLLAQRLDEARGLVRPAIAAAETRSLTPTTEATRRLDGDPAAEIFHRGGALSLYLAAAELDATATGELAEYRATFSHSKTGGEWIVDGIRPDNMGGFSVILDRARLPSGHYRLKLETVAGDRRHPLGTYQFRLIAAGTADPR
ncbi:MAG: hypothetical protein AAFY88_22345, partial [Acidobacteriota bacterium]